MTPNHASAVILAALEGLSLTAEERACFQRHPPAGFTLFRRNISSHFPDIVQLNRDLQSLADLSLLIAVDQEGGRVARLRAPFPNMGPALLLAEESYEPEALQSIRNYGFVVGSVLRSLGFNVDFAPVLDILTREENHAIGDRCFGRDATSVAERGGAFLEGLQAAKVMGCLKHFPGQGDAFVDTHESGTRIEASRALLVERELQPFARWLHHCPMVMISHVTYTALDPDRPASLSSKIMLGLLREEMAYQGLIVSDDMNMKAIDQAREPWSEAIVASLAAGSDLLLVCREIERYRWAVEAISREAGRSPAFSKRLEDAAKRVHRLRSAL